VDSAVRNGWVIASKGRQISRQTGYHHEKNPLSQKEFYQKIRTGIDL
jgi:hypothetical protein